MKNKFLTAAMLLAATLQVACGGGSDDGAQPSSASSIQEICKGDAACLAALTNPGSSPAAVTGLAASMGLPQVSAAGTTPVSGQVSGAVPASVSSSQIEAQRAKIANAMKAMSQSTSGVGGSGPIQPMEVGVTRLADAPQAAVAAVRAPSSVGVSAANIPKESAAAAVGASR